MADVPAPRLVDAKSATLRSIFALFGRGLIYALAFWTVYRGMLLVYPPANPSADSDDALRRKQSSQLSAYDEQARKADQMLEESEKQQARTSALLSKQEEQARRFDAVLDRWEKQSGRAK